MLFVRKRLICVGIVDVLFQPSAVLGVSLNGGPVARASVPKGRVSKRAEESHRLRIHTTIVPSVVAPRPRKPWKSHRLLLLVSLTLGLTFQKSPLGVCKEISFL